MSVNLSIKSVPDDLVELLRFRAERNHRSLQGELMTILEESLIADRSPEMLAIEKLRRVKIKTSSTSKEILRADRDRK